jgi:hypothetical protein
VHKARGKCFNPEVTAAVHVCILQPVWGHGSGRWTAADRPCATHLVRMSLAVMQLLSLIYGHR